MPVLVYQLGPHPTVVPVTAGELTIGRDRANDVILNHPTVGRRHARVVADADGSVWVSDLGSCNGTRVDGVPVGRRTRLAAPSRLRVGRVRVWFRDRPPAGLEEAGASGRGRTDAGSTRRCACGSRVWLVEDPGDRSVLCRRCGRPVEATDDPSDGLRVSTPAPASGGGASGETVFGSDAVSAATCPVCRWAVEPGDLTTRCGECGLTYHAECWAENRGCATFGCAEVGALERPAGATGGVAADGIAAGDADAGAGDAPSPGDAWSWTPGHDTHAADGSAGGALAETISEEHPPSDPATRTRLTARRLAVANVAASVVGLPAFGLPPLAVATLSAVWLKHRAGEARGDELPGATAVALGLAGAAIGAAVSMYLWL